MVGRVVLVSFRERDGIKYIRLSNIVGVRVEYRAKNFELLYEVEYVKTVSALSPFGQIGTIVGAVDIEGIISERIGVFIRGRRMYVGNEENYVDFQTFSAVFNTLFSERVKEVMATMYEFYPADILISLGKIVERDLRGGVDVYIFDFYRNIEDLVTRVSEEAFEKIVRASK